MHHDLRSPLYLKSYEKPRLVKNDERIQETVNSVALRLHTLSSSGRSRVELKLLRRLNWARGPAPWARLAFAMKTNYFLIGSFTRFIPTITSIWI